MQQSILDTDLVGETVSYCVGEEKEAKQGVVRAVTLSETGNYVFLLVQSLDDGSLSDIKAENCKVVS